ncbi:MULTISPECIES: TetR/AcrR family transcriptional regulator [Commensalibacter]|uniref:TetR family transcriptional regulator n=2 Tax=Commensalibacter TaxID=1079922 RepID=W7DVG3_9PROT|nr:MULTISPECIES: TetR/AcrR family transcriptional regulator [Commensalibacter]EUK19025.1 TetR family transcriptional regulator [Commensalibacter papalotli (ex Servin-Garciduenas et al. 2014)]CAI3923896.1 AcrR family [Commensalibacter papalotli (ex Botero et al. 2024)]CAI3928147.1 AcrR family [Commensalibacter papalotli (ex Botero et al. 2024)]
MNSIPNNKKNLLLKTGQEIFASHGFTNVGLTELLKKAGIPKGSFYYYFDSKEDYGVAVIQYYMDQYTTHLSTLFNTPDLSGKERLLSCWENWNENQCNNDYEGRCLVVKLSSEVADFSEAMRHEFCKGIDKVLTLIASVIYKGQQDGSIPDHLNPDLTAQELYQQWLGASLLTKIQRNKHPFKIALRYTMNILEK